MANCDHCDQPYNPADVDPSDVPGGEGLCWDCLVACCTNCGDLPPYPVDEVTQLCEMCHEHIFGDEHDPQD